MPWRAIRIGIWAIASLVLLLIAGVGILALSFDPNSLKPTIIAAVKQQTGRDLVLQGPIRLGYSLQPTLTVQGVSFSNPPGFSRPQMATLQELDLRLALLPLIHRRVEINRLVLVKPDILLETNAKGQPNWIFTPPLGATTPRGAPAETKDKTQTEISVAEIEVRDGTVTWRDGATGRSAVLGLPSLKTTAASPDANLHLAMTASYNGNPFTLSGDVGALARLQDTAAKTAWPVQLTVQAAGAKLTLDGSISQPEQARGYTLKVAANVPDLTKLAPFAPAATLPPLHDVRFAAQVADTGAKLPEISGLTLHIGQSDLSSLAATLTLDKLDVTAPKADQPAQIAMQATFNNAPATLSGSAGLLPVLLSGGKPTGPVPIDLAAQALGSSLTVKGTASYTNGLPSVQAAVQADKIDADKLIAVLAKPKPAPAPTAASASPPPSAPARQDSGRVIPDTPIPFNLLRLADADVKLNVAELTWGGAQYKSIAAHLKLQGGKLQLDQVLADLPAGHLEGALTAADTPPAPPVTLRLNAPALALGPLFAAIGKPDYVSGNLELHADLSGAGATPHAIAASLNGTLGAAMVGGTVDNRLLGSALGSVLRAVNALDLVGRGGASEIQCFAARLDARNGVATLRSLVLAASLMNLQGSGTINLGSETLDLHLLPEAKLVGTPIVVPLRVTGTLRAPATASDPAATVASNVGSVAGSVIGTATAPLGLLGDVFGGKKLLGGGSSEGPNCGAAVAIARGGVAPAAAQAPAGRPAAPAAQPAPAQPKKPPTIGNVLKKFCSGEALAVKRFWDTATIEPTPAGHAILLDGKPMHLPGGPVLLVESEPLARAIAEEWQAAGGGKGGEMSFADTPLTRLAGTAQQRIAPDPAPTIDAIARYAESDLLCYRAEMPPELAQRQMREWQPWLDWVALAYDAPLRVSTGVAYVKQHRGSLATLRAGVAALDVPALAALGIAVPALGSLVLGLALADARLDAATAHALGALEELFQVEAWGEDAEAVARRTSIAADIALAERFLRLTRGVAVA